MNRILRYAVSEFSIILTAMIVVSYVLTSYDILSVDTSAKLIFCLIIAIIMNVSFIKLRCSREEI